MVAQFGAEQGMDGHISGLSNSVQNSELWAKADGVVVHDLEGVLTDQCMYIANSQAIPVAHDALVGFNAVEIDPFVVSLSAVHGAFDPFAVKGNVEATTGCVCDFHDGFSLGLELF